MERTETLLWEAAAPRLYPVLRSTTSPEQALAAAARDPSRALVRARVAPFLHQLLVLDHGDHVVYVTRADLERWEIAADDARIVALTNLQEGSGLTQRSDGLWSVEVGDGYDASRLLLPAVLKAFADQVQGRVLAAVPHARCLLVGGEDQAGLLQTEALRLWESEGQPVSPCLYHAEGSGLLPYVGGKTPEVALAIERAVKQFAKREYERQREQLEGLFEVLVARFGLLEDEASGRLIQVCSWTEGTAPLLPMADIVVLHPTEGESVWVPFRVLHHVLPDALPVWEDLEPPRFATRRWPSAAEWGQLVESSLAS